MTRRSPCPISTAVSGQTPTCFESTTPGTRSRSLTGKPLPILLTSVILRFNATGAAGTLARKHWEDWLPERVAELRAEGKLDEALHGAARAAQKQIDHLMRDRHYQEHEAREVALRQHILLPPEPDALEPPEQREESEELEREYQKYPPPT